LRSGQFIEQRRLGYAADMAKAFGLSQGDGALVADVTPGSPAAKAGIEMGDIILELNGQPVSAPDDLSLHISQERADCHTTRKSYKTALTVGWSDKSVPTCSPDARRSGPPYRIRQGSCNALTILTGPDLLFGFNNLTYVG
jgi:serine protease Do